MILLQISVQIGRKCVPQQSNSRAISTSDTQCIEDNGRLTLYESPRQQPLLNWDLMISCTWHMVLIRFILLQTFGWCSCQAQFTSAELVRLPCLFKVRDASKPCARKMDTEGCSHSDQAYYPPVIDWPSAAAGAPSILTGEIHSSIFPTSQNFCGFNWQPLLREAWRGSRQRGRHCRDNDCS